MIETALIALYTVFLWWLSTALVFFAASLPRSTQRMSMAIASIALLTALHAVQVIGDVGGVVAALASFTAAIVIWGWGETTFLFGLVTGSNRQPCPPGVTGWQRFELATRAILHHELLLVALGLLIWFHESAHGLPVASLTFGTLWLLRLSAKLNLFLGTPNFSEELTPAHLRYLGTYFRRGRCSPLLPVSLILAALLAMAFGSLAGAATGDLERTSFTLLCVLTALGTLEHLMMLLPWRDTALWTWLFENGRKFERERIAPEVAPRTGETG